MRVGVPRELKRHEYRVGVIPVGVAELVRHGHDVLVEAGAGAGSGFSDEEYRAAGATIVADVDQVWADADLIVKVKEPVAEEFPRMRAGQTLFTYLHLAADEAVTNAILSSGTTAIAYETVTAANGTLPLLAPMSEVAGRMAAQIGAGLLQRPAGGTGTLMGGVPGAPAAEVVIIGAGVAGMNAATIAVGMQASVTIVDKNVERLREASARFGSSIRTVISTTTALEELCRKADLVIGAVLIPGAKAPRLVSSELVASMRPGSVLIDIAIDQGGCFEDSRPTTHDDPTFQVAGSTFYCVANMPGAYPRTSTIALSGLTLPYVLELADLGWLAACREDPSLAAGLSAHAGHLLSPQVAIAQSRDWASIDTILLPQSQAA